MSKYTSILYTRPTFVEGLARLFDFQGTLDDYNYSRTEKEADDLAMRADWHAVGDDLREAFRAYDREQSANRRS